MVLLTAGCGNLPVILVSIALSIVRNRYLNEFYNRFMNL